MLGPVFATTFFSTFASWAGPAAGLLLMRLVVGIALVVRRIIELQSAPPISLAMIHVSRDGPQEYYSSQVYGLPSREYFWRSLRSGGAFTHPYDPWSYNPVGNPRCRAGHARTGEPGPSMPAFFGWKRIDIRDRKK